VWHCHILEHEDNEMDAALSRRADAVAARRSVMGGRGLPDGLWEPLDLWTFGRLDLWTDAGWQ
jgi:hypothetical protein